MSVARPNVECIMGEWRRPHNDLQKQNVGGGHKAIHDDATAAAVGFKGAPIHGTVHWSQFTPLLLQTFGPSWFEHGSISVHFRTPVTHLEPVRAFIAKPKPGSSAQQVDIWMEHLDGRVVLEGTASAGLKPGETTTMVQSKLRGTKAVQNPLLFERQKPGTKSVGRTPMCISFEGPVHPRLFPFSLKEKLEIITEYHPWFAQDTGPTSPWGRPVLPPELLNAVMLEGLEPTRWPAAVGDDWVKAKLGDKTPVGLFGGCEVFMHNGPVFTAEPYELSYEVLATGETPRAEFVWTRASLWKAHSETLVAQMTLQSLYLKQSVEGYDQLRADFCKQITSKL
mmetsp:Transcript_21197/g.38692  ORF Transcript_21197/g.38692 Transcript_21197/m.38692 type:complete len:338 (-) Transcript_21197:50-1063(-)